MPNQQTLESFTYLQLKQLLASIYNLITFNCLTECRFHLFPDIPPCPAAQVVHSAGRRFIVSPVPEARLKEPSCHTSPPPAIAPPAETGQRRVSMHESV